MFKTARLKLTAWYLAIIMVISLFFSMLMYRAVTFEFGRRFHAIERRLELPRFGMRPPVGQTEFFIADIEEARRRIFLVLAYMNGAIFVFSAVAGYFLAGKTLAPIEAAMEEQKRFVADASHELKTPLTALHTSIEVALRDKKMTLEEAARVLRESLTDIRSLTQLSNDLLSLARYQQGQNNFKKELVNIKDVVSEARRLIAPFARKLRIALSADVQSVTITANKESLIKLLTILFDNAVKYSRPGGSVTVTTIRGRKQLAIVIQDTGVGISAPDLPHIFDRFYRVDQSRTKHKVTGFGLGLSMVKKIAALHGGSIDASSIVGKGSIFTVKLPL